MRPFLRFPFSATDQGLIDAGTVTAQDIAYEPAPAADRPYPQALNVSFRVNSTLAASPQVRPLFPGVLRFIADPAAPGVLPQHQQVAFDAAAYAGWRTLGALMVIVETGSHQEMIKLGSGLEVVPNIIWYAPVRITIDFLFNTLRAAPAAPAAGLVKRPIPIPAGGSIGVNNPDWGKHAVAGFLSGRYTPSLRLGANAAADDVERFAMPSVEVNTAGEASLRITAALAQNPQDAPDSDFDPPGGVVSRDAPAHPRNGRGPARHVYRTLRASLIDAAAPVADALLADWPRAPRYFPIRFTRTWKPIDNCSVHLPTQQVRVGPAGVVVPLAVQRLPAHGVFYFTQDSPGPPPAVIPDPPQVRIEVVGGMRFLDGATADSWRVKGDVQPLDYDLAVGVPHVCLRRRMREELRAERRVTPGDELCTYLSMRRSVRALVNNRICGGRLNFGVGMTSAPTRQLMNDAWNGLGVTSAAVANSQPPTNGPSDQTAGLRAILIAFYPATVNPRTITNGAMAYDLWQSRIDRFRNTPGNYPEHIGRGAPGALKAVGLAAYHLDPARIGGEGDAAYFDRIVADMLAGLEPGAALQFWDLDSDFVNIKARGDAIASFGHSPVFSDYMEDGAGNRTGIRVIDQFGTSDCPVVTDAAGRRMLSWHGGAVEVWIAANWDE